MGLLTIFAKPPAALLKLPSGSFTVDRDGSVLIGTVSSSFPRELISDIAQQVLTTFREAQTTNLPLSELIINYPSLKIFARELRGGAFIFLSPKALYAPASQR